MPNWGTPGELGCAIPFQQVEPKLVAMGQGEQLHAGAHPHEPLHLCSYTQYPSNLARKVRGD